MAAPEREDGRYCTRSRVFESRWSQRATTSIEITSAARISAGKGTRLTALLLFPGLQKRVIKTQ